MKNLALRMCGVLFYNFIYVIVIPINNKFFNGTVV